MIDSTVNTAAETVVEVVKAGFFQNAAECIAEAVLDHPVVATVAVGAAAVAGVAGAGFAAYKGVLGINKFWINVKAQAAKQEAAAHQAAAKAADEAADAAKAAQ